MNQRLQQFLDLENISPARLSEILNVQRSNISHILNGRNKPSYDFICRMLLKFPTLNADWLLTGKGKPYKESFPPLIGTENNLSGSKSRYENSSNVSNIAGYEDQDGDNSLFTLNSYSTITPNKASYSDENEKNTELSNNNELAENSKNAKQGTIIREKRKVKSVVIFYDDGSFDELKPEK